MKQREKELERAYHLGKAIDGIERCRLLYPDPATDGELVECAARLKRVHDGIQAPVGFCRKCGAEWDGRSAPPEERWGCDHRWMVEMWENIQDEGLARGQDEPGWRFVERVDETVYGG
jgi:hypothetical protein